MQTHGHAARYGVIWFQTVSTRLACSAAWPAISFNIIPRFALSRVTLVVGLTALLASHPHRGTGTVQATTPSFAVG